MKKYKLSIIVHCNNDKEYLLESIRSIYDQRTSIPYEVIVIHDNFDIYLLNELSKFDENIKTLTKNNCDLASDRYIAVEMASSEIVLFLDADYQMLPDRIEFQGRFMLESPDIGLSYGAVNDDCFTEYHDTETFDSFSSHEIQFTVINDAYRRLLDFDMFAPIATAIRREIYLEAVEKSSKHNIAEDYAMCISIGKIANIALSKKTLNKHTQFRRGGISKTPSVHYGPSRALADELIKIEKIPNLFEIYIAGRRRLDVLCNKLLKDDFINDDGKYINKYLEEFFPLISDWLILKWTVIIFFVPSFIGRRKKF